MAHSVPPSANRLAQHSNHFNESDNRDSIQQPTTDAQSSLQSSDSLLSSDTELAPVNAPLRVHVERVVREYFAALEDEMPTDFYELILREVELPLLTVVLEQTRGNQTKCAQILGLNRGTLRKKLKTHNLM
jgi:Fis family transcriptional regulator, factor for inversion stimulation protein